jgi:CubicO group peptidase (beta-lactamase class C family)
MKTLFIACIFLFGSLNFSFSATQSKPASMNEALVDIETFIRHAMATGGTVGMSVGIVRGNEILYSKGFGFADREKNDPVTPDTLFYIASTTKSFTALTAALLAASGKIDLDAPFSKYLPGVALAPPLSPDTITLRDLLSMTHGIDGDGPVTFRTAYTGEFTNDLLLQLIRLHPPLPGGRKFVYSNLGYNLLGLVLDSQFKEGWKRLVQQEVFDPLGMTHTTCYISQVPPNNLAQPYELAPDGRLERVSYAKTDSNMHAAGGHVSSANDLARYLVAQLNGGKINGRQALPEAVINATHQQQTEQDRMYGPYHRTGWALGWDIGTYDGEVLFHRFGGFSGFHSHVSFMPQPGIGVVVLVNGGDAASPLSDLVATYIYQRLLDRPNVAATFDENLTAYAKRLETGKAAVAKNAAARAARPQQIPLPLKAYTGTYESFALGKMIWTMAGNHLHVTMGAASSDVEVYDGTKNQFRVELTGNGEIVTFGVQDGASVPPRLIYSGYTFERSR